MKVSLDKDRTCQPNTAGEPWYRQFWPWFLLALPAAVVCASLYTLVLANRHGDQLVSDNYYRDGLAINERLSQDERARVLGLSARIEFADNGGEFAGDGIAVVIRLAAHPVAQAGDLPDQVTLLLLHPTDVRGDITLVASAVGGAVYRGHLSTRPAHRFYLRVMPGSLRDGAAYNAAPWRLNGEIDFAREHTRFLGSRDIRPAREKDRSNDTSESGDVR